MQENQQTEKTKKAIAKRFLTQELVQVEVFGRIGKIFCKMGNLSVTGVFCEIISANYMPRSGDLVRVTVNLRSLKKVRTMDAEVIWCKGLGTGLHFLTPELFRKKLSQKSNPQL